MNVTEECEVTFDELGVHSLKVALNLPSDRDTNRSCNQRAQLSAIFALRQQ